MEGQEVVIGMSKGFGNIPTPAGQWATRPDDQRYETLEALLAAVKGRRLRSLAWDAETPNLKVLAPEDGQLLVSDEREKVAMVPTHWAFGQLASLVGAPASYLRKLSTPTAALALNESIQDSGRQAVKLFGIVDDEGGKAQFHAVTSQTYGRIWDADLIEATQRVVEKSNGKFHNPPDWSGRPSGLYASDRDVFAFLIDGGSIVEAGRTAAGKDDVLHRGFFVWNSEVGSKTFGIATFLFRVVCGNHLIWGAQDVRILKVRHTLYAPERFASEVYPTLAAQMNRAAAPEEAAIRKAQQHLLPRDTKEFQEWGLKYGLTKNEIKQGQETANREEGDCRTLWQFVNGVTSYAKKLAYADARVDLESRAAKLLDIAAA